MRKILLLACLAVGTVWASEPASIIRGYNLEKGGYVLINANDQVVAFTNSGDLESSKEELEALLSGDGYVLHIAAETKPSDYVIADSVGPLLGDIAFNQGAPYNRKTPFDVANFKSEKHCVTGCVATAMAQILKYHNYPLNCQGGKVTTTKSNPVSLNFDTISFDWDKILPTYDGGVQATDEQKDEVAKLMLACGVSVNMNYTSESSGTMSEIVSNAFQTYFDYKCTNLESRTDVEKFPTDESFEKALQFEFNNGRPVYASAQYSGSEKGFDGGHAFVIDGCGWLGEDTQHEVTFYHFNWGWGGYNQKGQKYLWYTLTGSLNPTPYRTNLSVIRWLRPRPEAEALVETPADVISNDNVYDIMGRVVTTTTPGMLYIKNGKKFIAQ